MSTLLHPVRRALLSVSDKNGLVERAQTLIGFGVELVSTGGTARLLKEAGLSVRDVSDLTGFPEMMDGRVKTLHPAIHGGLLFRRDHEQHVAQAQQHGILPIDLVFIDLYPFEQTLASGADFETCIENIDIGGPAMLRSAAKNADRVVVCCDMVALDTALEQMREQAGQTDLPLRQSLAARSFARTAAYDASIAGWYARQTGQTAPGEWQALGGQRVQALRYGENPHQAAALYRAGHARPGVLNARQIQGKPLSYNNINDIDAAFELVAECGAEQPAAAIIKHASPCGVATANTVEAAYRAALAADPVSAFGGVVALSRPLDAQTAGAIIEVFTEVVMAPGADEAALQILSAKKNLRVLVTESMPDLSVCDPLIRSIAGGFLVQDRDAGQVAPQDWQCVTAKEPSAAQMSDLLFAWRVVKHVRSNAVVYASDGAVCGIGGGQTSRLDAAKIGGQSVRKSGKIPCVAASDAFFPFADGLESVVEAGANAIIQPGGSMRDEDVIKAADRLGVSMVFTGMRHFRH